MKEMRAAGGEYQIVLYGEAVHAFTDPVAGDDPFKGAAYGPVAAQRSWDAMKILFAETIGLPKPAGDNDEGVVATKFAGGMSAPVVFVLPPRLSVVFRRARTPVIGDCPAFLSARPYPGNR